MAYVSQEDKKARMPAIKAILKEYGLKGTVRVRHHMVLVLTIREGEIDFGKDHAQVNPYWIESHYEGTAQEALTKLRDALKGEDYYDRSDIMTDYFDVSHYVDINIGNWNKPYVYTGA